MCRQLDARACELSTVPSRASTSLRERPASGELLQREGDMRVQPWMAKQQKVN